MSVAVSQRVQRIKPSPTLAVTAKAAALKAQGKAVLSLGAGEPDFDTPDHIKAAAEKAIRAGFTKYTAVGGIPSLKQAIAAKYRRDNDLEYAPAQILVCNGGKQACYNLCMALLNEGDEAIVPAPYWVSYPDMVLLAGGKPVIVFTGPQTRYKLTAAALEAAITPRTRLIFLNSPSNPTGMAYLRSELAALGEVLRRHPQVVIASDDMYEKILWGPEPFANIVNVCPDLYERTFCIHAVSKTYAMTGWRVGWICGDRAVIQAMDNVQSQSTSNPCSISQVAAEAALSGDQSSVQVMREAFKRRHDHLVEGLNRIPGIKCLPGDGTFYALPEVSGLMSRMGVKDDLQLAEVLLERSLLAAVPGSAFGAPDHLRLSFAVSDAVLEECLERLAALG